MLCPATLRHNTRRQGACYSPKGGRVHRAKYTLMQRRQSAHSDADSAPQLQDVLLRGP